jgi:U6 snRNA-associated Sm-like protein LSm2
VVTVELKNDLAITGILHSVDQYLNIKLENTRVVDEAKYPHMVRTFSSKSRVFVVRFSFFSYSACALQFSRVFPGFCSVSPEFARIILLGVPSHLPAGCLDTAASSKALIHFVSFIFHLHFVIF